MPKLPRIPSRVIVHAFKRAGFYVYHQSGSHAQFRHPEHREMRITIPITTKDIAPKTLQIILKQAQLTVDEFIDLL